SLSLRMLTRRNSNFAAAPSSQRMEQLIDQFLEHLRYERNVSEHTLRNYRSDLEQFLDYLTPVDAKTGKRNELPIQQIDHITVREWMACLHSAQKKRSSVARKLRSEEHTSEL